MGKRKKNRKKIGHVREGDFQMLQGANTWEKPSPSFRRGGVKYGGGEKVALSERPKTLDWEVGGESGEN